MTIQESRDQQELSTTMFQNMATNMVPRKNSQWQSPPTTQTPFTSLFRLLVQPDPPQEMNMINHDICQTNPSYENPNVASFRANPSLTTEDKRDPMIMPSVSTESSTSNPYLPRSIALQEAGRSTKNIASPIPAYQQGQEQRQMVADRTSNFWSYQGKFSEYSHHHTAGALNLEDQRGRICPEGTSYPSKLRMEHGVEMANPTTAGRLIQDNRSMFTYAQSLDQPRQAPNQEANRGMCGDAASYLPKSAIEHGRGTEKQMETNRSVQDQRSMFTFMQSLDQPREFCDKRSTQFSDVPGLHRLKAQPNQHHSSEPAISSSQDLLQRFSLSSQPSTCLNAASNITSATEHRGVIPQMQWSTSRVAESRPFLSSTDTAMRGNSANHAPTIQQESGWIGTNTIPTGHNAGSSSNGADSLHQQLNNNFCLGNRAPSQQMNNLTVLHNNELQTSEHFQYKWAFTNKHDSNVEAPRSLSETQSYRGLQPLNPLTPQEQVPKKPLFQQFNAYSLQTVQERLAQQSFTSNVALLRQFESYDVNQPTRSSPLNSGKDHVAVTNGYPTNQNVQSLEGHPNGTVPSIDSSAGGDMQQGSVSPSGIYDPKTGQLNSVVGESKRLSSLRTEMRKGSSQDGHEEPQSKQKRKKVRCKVLRDKSKPKPRPGRKPSMGNDTSKGANLHGEVENEVQNGRLADAETSPPLQPLEGSDTKSAPYQAGENSAFGLFCNEQTITRGDCASASNGISAGQKEISIGAGQMVVSNPDIRRLVDFLGLSDEKCRAGEKDTSWNTISINEPQSHTSPVEGNELVLYGQNYELSGMQKIHDLTSPFYLFSGETSSTGSTDLVVSNGSLPLVNTSKQDNLQLVPYDQKRDIVLSRPARTKIRAKVQLDPESQRVWLQLENGGSPEIDTDPDKKRYWEKERADMKKKIDIFIQKMHFVQGDRRFSPWKGSIVDSVVGAFLTQNVSDHLSSSAFMSVASRFPAVKKEETVDDMCTSPCEVPCAQAATPSIMEKGFSCSAAQPSSVKQHMDSNDMDESTANEIGSSEVIDFGTPVQHEERRNHEYQGQFGIGHKDYYDSLMHTPQSQLCTTPQKGQIGFLASDDERNSSCTFDIGDGIGTIDEISGSFGQAFPSRNNKVRRMLQFDEPTKPDSTSCSILEADKKVSFPLVHETETASDNISDQQSETESAMGSSSTVQSVQDSNSNLQLTTVQDGIQDLNYQIDIMQASNQELDTTLVTQLEKMQKKRTLSVSSISGMERAELEANQRGKKKNHYKDWECVRREVQGIPKCVKGKPITQRPRPADHEDSVNWEAVRLAELGELAETIKERGMHHVLSGRIKAFLTSIYEEHGSIDLEWLRNLSTEMTRDYLMSVHGLGVKSVECIRLLTLHHLAFPVDTNVGRICVRLGWVPIEPLPEEVQLHLVELYPIQETIQKYLWPRLCTLDQRTLYELHYQMITFGKVFCTKSKPNCNACPLRTECKHFASAYASARPLLTGPQEDGLFPGNPKKELPALSMDGISTALLQYPQDISLASQEAPLVSEIDSNTMLPFRHQNQPSVASYGENFYVEMPASPEQTYEEEDLMDIEDMGANMYIYNDYKDYSLDLIGENNALNASDHSLVAFINNQLSCQEPKAAPTPSTLSATHVPNSLPSPVSKYNTNSPHGCCNDELVSTSEVAGRSFQCINDSGAPSTPTYQTDIVEVSQNAIVMVPEAARIPAPVLKNVGRMRTIHYVYELPDDHCLLNSVDPREKDDPCSYLLAIWGPGETPESQQEIDEVCRDEFSSSSSSAQADETVAGTLLIPCRTAMHGSFPLNGTYFQVNEVFADHESSLHPLQVPRSLLWSLRRRFVYFGTSVPNIFKGFSQDEIKDCFWRGHVCVRGFDRQTRAPKPLVCRLHFPVSKQPPKPAKLQRKKKDETSGISTSET